MKKNPNRPPPLNEPPGNDETRELGRGVTDVGQDRVFMNGYLDWLKEIMIERRSARLPADSDMKTDIPAYKRHLESLKDAEKDTLEEYEGEGTRTLEQLNHDLSQWGKRLQKILDEAKDQPELTSLIKAVQEAIQKGQEPDFSRITDVYTVEVLRSIEATIKKIRASFK